MTKTPPRTRSALFGGSHPKLLTLMDEALASARGIRLHYPSWTAASAARNQCGKARHKAGLALSEMTGLLPGDPGYGQSQYNDLAFSVEPDLRGVTVTIDFLLLPREKQRSRPSRTTLLNLLAAAMKKTGLPELSLREFHSPIAPNSNLHTLLSFCSVSATRLDPDGTTSTFFAERAPTFGLAWAAIIRSFPAWLYIHNSPQAEQLPFETL